LIPPALSYSLRRRLLTPRLRRIRLVVCDVDGVLTDGGLSYDEDGKVVTAGPLPPGLQRHGRRMMQTHRRRQMLTEAEWRRCLATVLLGRRTLTGLLKTSRRSQPMYRQIRSQNRI
jgi:hypothetical protein